MALPMTTRTSTPRNVITPIRAPSPVFWVGSDRNGIAEIPEGQAPVPRQFDCLGGDMMVVTTTEGQSPVLAILDGDEDDTVIVTVR